MTMAHAVQANAKMTPVPSYFSGKQWQQVLGRDPRADGQFVYAVKSTGIYCRPSCASRRPQRKHVAFFPSPALAEAAGYRACKRCGPERAEAKPDPQEGAVQAAVQYLRDHADERTPFEDVARAVGIGRLPLLRGFKPELSQHTVEVNRLENDGDRITREAVASLFDTRIDPMVVIRWKDIFERLEEAIDATERAVNTLEGIIIKNR